MDSLRFDELSRAVATGTSRRQLGRLLAGSVLAGAGLIRGSTDTAAGGKRCCRKQKRRFRRAKRECEQRGGEFQSVFSCDPATCDPDVFQVFLCAL